MKNVSVNYIQILRWELLVALLIPLAMTSNTERKYTEIYTRNDIN